VAAEAKKESDARRKAADARTKASKASSASSMSSYLREADRREKEANDAASRRARVEHDIAGKTKALYDAQAKVDKKRSADQAALQSLTRDLARRRDQPVVDSFSRDAQAQVGALKKAFDFFISHATSDKADIARPLYQALTARGCTVWFDEAEIRVGDSIRQKIDEGLRTSRYGIVVLSRTFLASKGWTQRELDGLFVQEEAAGEPRVLPLWHNVTKQEVADYSPVLADKAALKTTEFTVDELATLLHDRLAGAVTD
jgi:hypothetical protein